MRGFSFAVEILGNGIETMADDTRKIRKKLKAEVSPGGVICTAVRTGRVSGYDSAFSLSHRHLFRIAAVLELSKKIRKKLKTAVCCLSPHSPKMAVRSGGASGHDTALYLSRCRHLRITLFSGLSRPI